MSFRRSCLKSLLASAAILVAATAVLPADIAVIGGKTDDEFFNRIKKGVDDATLVVEGNGGSVRYLQLQSYDNIGADAAQLIRTAIGQGVDGIVVPNWVPDAEDDAIKAAIDAGIAVILMNAGNIDKARELGAINYVGSDEYLAGKAGGEYFVANGASNVVCVNTVPGAASLETRCQGVIDGVNENGGAAKQLPLPASAHGDQTAVSEAVKSTLLQDETIDGVINIGAPDADATAIGIQQAGKQGQVIHGSFDMNGAGLGRVQDGSQKFIVDQQPYLQALLAVQLLASHIDFGTDLPTAPILTGPGIIDSSNVEATLQGVEKGAR
ncbi:substrate-binding domain-containing protein [Paracoccus pantotrophus]|uniref:substrate-binding domain-containing protein n=1 Tax=Paracoccus pantotrophus TaxID=82367 RepID=UPI000463CF70|nr:substrate-binding domain-containing protein [Paracoccus pantotrophus]RDD97792.1 sugar ABC transporter substrate-binding protein [Paracoccus pantotrophus]WGR66184.1 sugar ABC transporter substrate-binding protein [Paracoccus pantotrophus]